MKKIVSFEAERIIKPTEENSRYNITIEKGIEPYVNVTYRTNRDGAALGWTIFIESPSYSLLDTLREQGLSLLKLQAPIK